jgi:hypothetical protein
MSLLQSYTSTLKKTNINSPQPNSVYKVSITLTPKLDKDTTGREKTSQLQTNFFDEDRWKNSQ